MPHKPGLGAIFGIVAESGLPVEGAPVRLIDRSTDRLVRRVPSREDGGFVFSGLDPTTDDYMVMVTDETADGEGAYFNALIQDRVQPVPIAVGTEYPARWVSIAKSYNPGILWPGPHVSSRFNNETYQTIAAANGGRAPVAAGIVNYDTVSPFTEQGASNLPVLHLQDSAWVRVLGHFQYSMGDHIKNRATIYTVADFSSAWGLTVRCSEQGTTNNGVYYGIAPYFTLAYDGGSNIRFVIGAYDDPYQVDTWSLQTIRKTYNVTIDPVPTGFSSVAVVFKGGSYVKLYVGDTEYVVDNTTVPTSQNTATNTYPGRYMYLREIALRGYSDTYEQYASSGPKFAFLMATVRVLTQAEINALTDALWNGGLPTESGYALQVTADNPSMYYRFNELDDRYVYSHHVGDGSDMLASDYYTRNIPYYEALPSSVMASEASPVAGQSVLVFDGNDALSNRMQHIPGSRNFTLEFWLRVDETPVANYIIFNSQTSYTDAVSVGIHLALIPSRVLSMYLAGPGETISFTDYTVPLDTFVHIAIVADKENEEARLVVNGELVQTVPVSSTAVAETYMTSSYSNDFHNWTRCSVVGGYLNRNTFTVTNGLKGVIAELAGYNYPVPTYRLLEHYLAKDIL